MVLQTRWRCRTGVRVALHHLVGHRCLHRLLLEGNTWRETTSDASTIYHAHAHAKLVVWGAGCGVSDKGVHAHHACSVRIIGTSMAVQELEIAEDIVWR